MHFQSHVHIEHAKNWVELLGVARRVKKGATKTASLLPNRETSFLNVALALMM